MKHPLRWLLAIVLIQVALIGGYRLIEKRRTAEPSTPVLSTQPPHEVSLELPPLTLINEDGTSKQLELTRPTLVHIWASWCEPCRDELPLILALPDSHGLDLYAISIDDSWSPLTSLLRGLPTTNIFLGRRAEIERPLSVRTLPVTFLIKPDSDEPVLRFDGARDWGDAGFRGRWLGD